VDILSTAGHDRRQGITEAVCFESNRSLLIFGIIVDAGFDLTLEEVERNWEAMKIRPLNDRILVKRVEEETVTKGGLIIPETAKEKPQRGEVIAVGPGKRGDDGKRNPSDVKAGDMVLFAKYAGTEIKIDGIEHVFMREDDILGVIS
jgi:chaperonin GroES